MAILDDVKSDLRITTDDPGIVGEVQNLIEAAKADLGLSGVVSEKIIETDPLIKRAVIVYCKANFGYDNPDADRLQKSYDELKKHLSLSIDYAWYTITFTVTSGGSPVDGAAITISDNKLITNSLGAAVHILNKSGTDIDYVVSADGYKSVEGYVYVDGSKEVGVMLNEA